MFKNSINYSGLTIWGTKRGEQIFFVDNLNSFEVKQVLKDIRGRISFNTTNLLFYSFEQTENYNSYTAYRTILDWSQYDVNQGRLGFYAITLFFEKNYHPNANELATCLKNLSNKFWDKFIITSSGINQYRIDKYVEGNYTQFINTYKELNLTRNSKRSFSLEKEGVVYFENILDELEIILNQGYRDYKSLIILPAEEEDRNRIVCNLERAIPIKEPVYIHSNNFNSDSTDFDFFQECSKIDTIKAYKDYLGKFPNGEFVEKAQDKINNLKDSGNNVDTLYNTKISSKDSLHVIAEAPKVEQTNKKRQLKTEKGNEQKHKDSEVRDETVNENKKKFSIGKVLNKARYHLIFATVFIALVGVGLFAKFKYEKREKKKEEIDLAKKEELFNLISGFDKHHKSINKASVWSMEQKPHLDSLKFYLDSISAKLNSKDSVYYTPEILNNQSDNNLYYTYLGEGSRMKKKIENFDKKYSKMSSLYLKSLERTLEKEIKSVNFNYNSMETLIKEYQRVDPSWQKFELEVERERNSLKYRSWVYSEASLWNKRALDTLQDYDCDCIKVLKKASSIITQGNGVVGTKKDKYKHFNQKQKDYFTRDVFQVFARKLISNKCTELKRDKDLFNQLTKQCFGEPEALFEININ